jgi:hypothetical protein
MLRNVAEIDAEAVIPDQLAGFGVERDEALLRGGEFPHRRNQIQPIAEDDRRRTAADRDAPREVLALRRPGGREILLRGSAVPRRPPPLGPVVGREPARPGNHPCCQHGSDRRPSQIGRHHDRGCKRRHRANARVLTLDLHSTVRIRRFARCVQAAGARPFRLRVKLRRTAVALAEAGRPRLQRTYCCVVVASSGPRRGLPFAFAKSHVA